MFFQSPQGFQYLRLKGEIFFIFAGNKSEISLNLPLLWVPISILLILYIYLEIK